MCAARNGRFTSRIRAVWKKRPPLEAPRERWRIERNAMRQLRAISFLLVLAVLPQPLQPHKLRQTPSSRCPVSFASRSRKAGKDQE